MSKLRYRKFQVAAGPGTRTMYGSWVVTVLGRRPYASPGIRIGCTFFTLRQWNRIMAHINKALVSDKPIKFRAKHSLHFVEKYEMSKVGLKRAWICSFTEVPTHELFRIDKWVTKIIREKKK